MQIARNTIKIEGKRQKGNEGLGYVNERYEKEEEEEGG